MRKYILHILLALFIATPVCAQQRVVSYKQGFAHNASESANSSLWKRLVFAGVPSLGVTGNRLVDVSGVGSDGLLAGTTLPSWIDNGLEFTSDARLELADRVGDLVASRGTIIAVIRWDGSSGHTGHIFDTRTGSANGWDFFIFADVLTLEVDTGVTITATVAIDTTTIGDIVMTATYNGSFLQVSANGIFGTAEAQTGDALRTATTKIGNQANNADPLGSGLILKSLLVYDIAVVNSQILSHVADPFGFLRTRQVALGRVPDAPAARRFINIAQLTNRITGGITEKILEMYRNN